MVSEAPAPGEGTMTVLAGEGCGDPTFQCEASLLHHVPQGSHLLLQPAAALLPLQAIPPAGYKSLPLLQVRNVGLDIIDLEKEGRIGRR